jgi:hypothetical protein
MRHEKSIRWLGVPDPSKSPAQDSLILLFFAMLLIPLGIDPGLGQQEKTN